MTPARLLAASIVVAACSGPSILTTAVFVGADHETVECGADAPCVRVFSEVDGTGVGAGRCLLYASTTAGQVAVAASGELELSPGTVVEWVVRVPDHLGSLGWNPVCVPTAEG